MQMQCLSNWHLKQETQLQKVAESNLWIVIMMYYCYYYEYIKSSNSSSTNSMIGVLYGQWLPNGNTDEE